MNKRRPTQQGFTYLMLLLWVAVAGVVLAALGTSWSTMQRREREAEWLFRGEQYRAALRSYASAAPGGELPERIDQLLEDRRSGQLKRHLRQAYLDPITRGPWGLMLDKGRIQGVYSLSTEQPLKKLANAKHYQDLVFAPAEVSASSPGPTPSAASGLE